MDIRKLMTSFLMVALFIIAIISFGVNIAQDNDAEKTIMEDTTVSTIYNGTHEVIGSSANSSEAAAGTLLNSSDSFLGEVAADFIIPSIKAVALNLFGAVTDIFGVILNPLMNLLGLPEEITSVISAVMIAIFTFTIVLLIWKLWKQGK